MHNIKDNEVLGKLKFVAKGEPTRKPRNAQSSVATLGKGRGKGYMSRDPNQALELDVLVSLEEHRKREEECRTKARHAALVLDKEVNKEVNEGFREQMKLKLKVVEQITPDVQLLLDLKKDTQACRDPHSDSSDSFSWETSDDEKTDSDDYDTGDDQAGSFGILVHDKEQEQPIVQPHSPSVTVSSHEDVSRYLNENPERVLMDIMSGPVYTETQTTSLVPIQEGNPKVQDDPPVNTVMSSPPATTTHILVTKS
ncbi:hypothetical protein Tco_1502661 [Tanacetum coccineum]